MTNPHEYHRTPAWCVRRLIERIRLPARHAQWCDPCAGDGAIMDAVPGYRAEAKFNRLLSTTTFDRGQP